MIPNNRLSTPNVPDEFIGASVAVYPDLTDAEWGGIGIGDASRGDTYQLWTAEVRMDDLGDRIYLYAPNTLPILLYEGAVITEVSLTFDQLLRPVLAFVEEGVAKLRWYDSSVEADVVTPIGSDVANPKVTLDDRRQSQAQNSDIILAYLRDGSLYYRQQRDRFNTERLLQSGNYIALKRIGMNRGYRLQFHLARPDEL